MCGVSCSPEYLQWYRPGEYLCWGRQNVTFSSNEKLRQRVVIGGGNRPRRYTDIPVLEAFISQPWEVEMGLCRGRNCIMSAVMMGWTRRRRPEPLRRSKTLLESMR